MPRYIDADALLKAMNTWDKFGFSHSGAFVREPKNKDYVPYVHYADMVKCVEGIPTADVVERKVGKWIEPTREGCITFDKHGYAECSACGGKSYLGWWMHYCPNCGAEMSERRDDATLQ